MKRTLPRLLVFAVLVVGMLAAPPPARAATGPRCYVDMDASGGSNNGNSWVNAYTSLQFALTDINCTEIWVAAGAYMPGLSATDTFNILPGHKVYGGFSGTETDLSQRNVILNLTILSGDIGGDDVNTDGNYIAETTSDIVVTNSQHVVTIDGRLSPVNTDTVLDGFVVTGGDADTVSVGGGLYCMGGGSSIGLCNPTLNLLVFSGNRATHGGAMFLTGAAGGNSSPAISGTYFTGNRALDEGGAIYLDGYNGTSSPNFLWVTFGSNSAVNKGGAVYNRAGNGGTSNPAFTLTTFDSNTAAYGGAVYTDAEGGTGSPAYLNVTFMNNYAGYGGAIYNDGSNGGNSSPSLTNVTFYANGVSLAVDGGAMYNEGSPGGQSSPVLLNVTFNDNHAGYGGAMYNDSFPSGTSLPQLTNVILWGDSASALGPEIYNYGATTSIDHSVVQGGCPAGSNCINPVDGDPKLGVLTFNYGLVQSMALLGGSSAIDTGLDASCPFVDARPISRPRGLHCDIGAYERIPPEKADFDGDYASDIGYFHPAPAAAGLWGILKSSQNFSYGSAQYITWGQTGDLVVPGDFDGDGKLDPTVRRPPAGGQSAAYLILNSYSGYDYGCALTVPAGWPGLGDTPVVGDFNGDRISDPAIWRGNTGVWIIALAPGFSTHQFYSWGQTGDTPIAADVDNDGRTDIGYWRPSTGVWGFLLSTQTYSYAKAWFVNWGTSGDIPVMADYDGDGKSDPAVVIPPAGGQSRAYRILLSSTNYNPSYSSTIPAGWPGLGDTPVPADYDGDTRADPAIWRANTGVWIIPKSSTSYSSYIFAAWGASGDQPAR
jgi:predicted outer membrane repeat protein